MGLFYGLLVPTPSLESPDQVLLNPGHQTVGTVVASGAGTETWRSLGGLER